MGEIGRNGAAIREIHYLRNLIMYYHSGNARKTLLDFGRSRLGSRLRSKSWPGPRA